MFSKVFKEKYYPEIEKLLQKKPVLDKQIILNILEKKKLDLFDINCLIEAFDNIELRNLIIETASKKREKQWHNRLFLVPPLYVTDRCVNDCLYCPWRKSNLIQRRSLNEGQLIKETDFLIKQGYRTIELVGASDPLFSSEQTAKFISIVKQKLDEVGGGEVGLNFESAKEEIYKSYINSGLYFMVLWQETYHPETYKKLHPVNTQKADMDYRLDAFDRAIQSGLKKVSLAFLGRLYNWKYEILALCAHGQYLEETYGIPPFIIGTPRWKYAEGSVVIENPYEYPDEAWILAGAIYKLVFPDSMPWFSTRENFDLSAKAIGGGGELFTLDCSTEVGGYTNEDNFPQFPVYSKPLAEGIKWLESMGYKPEFRLPK